MTASPRPGAARPVTRSQPSGGGAARPGPGVLANLCAQPRQGVRLEEILVAAGPLRLFGRRHPGRVDDHLDIRGVLARSDSPAELYSVYAGQLYISDRGRGGV